MWTVRLKNIPGIEITMKGSCEKDHPSMWFYLRPAVHVGFADVDCYHQFQPNGLHVRWKQTLLPWQTQTSFHMNWKWIEWRTAKMRKREGDNWVVFWGAVKTESNIDGLRTAGLGLARCLWKCGLPLVKTKYMTKRKGVCLIYELIALAQGHYQIFGHQ